ncbi:MAG: DUF302 domain-containing protein [Alphaproteobacteria bacterium]|nr:DUF302 domain-containing protein [Alphaproteobacteria bacterium]
MTRTLDCPFQEGDARIRTALAAQGFGVLTEIDLSATLKKKLDATIRPYRILGACHPQSAYAALQAEPAIGLLLPCNVVVTEDDAGHAVVSAIDPGAMFQVVQADGMDAVVEDVRARLQAAIDAA